MGDKPINTITRSDYQEFINWRASARAKNTVEKTHHHIRTCVTDAIEDKVISSNFTNKVVIKWDKPPLKEKHKYLNKNKTKVLLSHCYSLIPENSTSMLCVLLLKTGLRFWEMLVLSWDDIHIDNKTLTVSKEYDYNNALDFTGGKTYANKRMMTIDSALIKQLKKFKIIAKSNYLFLDEQAKPYVTYQAREKVRKKIFKEAELTNSVTFHGMRHTHWSILMYHNINIKYISRLGHKDILVTLNTYSHIIDELEQKENTTLESIFQSWE